MSYHQNIVIQPPVYDLLRFTESTASVQEFSDVLFLAFVDHIVVYDRNCIGFKLKCALTLREVI